MTNLHSNTIEAFTIFVMIMISIMVIAKHIITKVNLRRFLVHKRSGSVGNIRNSKQGFLRSLDKIQDNDLPKYLQEKIYYIVSNTHRFQRENLFSNSKLKTEYLPELITAYEKYCRISNYGTEKELEDAYAALENIVFVTSETFRIENKAIEALIGIKDAA